MHLIIIHFNVFISLGRTKGIFVSNHSGTNPMVPWSHSEAFKRRN